MPTSRMLFILALALGVGALVYTQVRPSPESVFADFCHSKSRAEDMLIDPLLLHANRVAPLVIVEIENKDMPRRRYAIGFLGQAGRHEALPILRRILADSAEADYFRADALQAINLIDPVEGNRLALDFLSSSNLLGHVARRMRDGSLAQPRRTYWQALTGFHE